MQVEVHHKYTTSKIPKPTKDQVLTWRFHYKNMVENKRRLFRGSMIHWSSGKGQELGRRTSSEDPTYGFPPGSNPAGVIFLLFFFLSFSLSFLQGTE